MRHIERMCVCVGHDAGAGAVLGMDWDVEHIGGSGSEACKVYPSLHLVEFRSTGPDRAQMRYNVGWQSLSGQLRASTGGRPKPASKPGRTAR